MRSGSGQGTALGHLPARRFLVLLGPTRDRAVGSSGKGLGSGPGTGPSLRQTARHRAGAVLQSRGFGHRSAPAGAAGACRSNGPPPHRPGSTSAMPRRDDLESILIIGSGPIVIGQACEFDYSGTQACKALREEGYRVVLVNSNPATIMTDPEMADATYIEPITPTAVTKILEQRAARRAAADAGRADGAEHGARAATTAGVLDRLGIEMIGAKAEVIRKAEDRDLFRTAMSRMRPRSAALRRRPHDGRRAARAGRDRPAVRDPPGLHAGRHRRRHRLQRRGVRGDRARAGSRSR